MIHVGDIMSTVGARVQYRGGYSSNKRFPPTVLMISPHMHHNIPHGTEHPP